MLKIEILLDVMMMVARSTNDIAMVYNIVPLPSSPKMKKKKRKAGRFLFGS